ncbi:MAG TPA: phytanoyl-CoA dioxygenase family protein [Candidatus Limnocylindrales bacterium]|nr:phytanoyl-CoA dioxygenase family protein [Candidatus Limnocylindrales bacterium]
MAVDALLGYISCMRRAVEEWLQAISDHGYVVLPEVLSAGEIAQIRRQLAPHLSDDDIGRNNFEGHLTQRVYSLVGVGPALEALAEHAAIMALCEALLEPNFLLTASQAIRILPGETSQPLHTDDAFYRIARPRKAISVSTIWAIDAFTEENGGTQIIPGSHRWSDEEVGDLLARIDFQTRTGGKPVEPELPEAVQRQLMPVTMPPGSVVVFLGTLVHRGGANRSREPRLALSNQYCEPWARPQENYFLSISPQRARAMSERVQSLLGYSIHPPFMGHALGQHPRKMLEDGAQRR